MSALLFDTPLKREQENNSKPRTGTTYDLSVSQLLPMAKY